MTVSNEEPSVNVESESVDSMIVSDPVEIDRQIESAFLSAMVDDTGSGFIRGVRTYYFPHRQLIIFTMTSDFRSITVCLYGFNL